MARSTRSDPYRTPRGTSSAYFEKGADLAFKAMILGLVGTFFMGIVLGPMALHYARQAEAYGNNKAYGGKFFGTGATIIGVAGVIFILGLIFSSMQPDLIEPGLSPTIANTVDP